LKQPGALLIKLDLQVESAVRHLYDPGTGDVRFRENWVALQRNGKQVLAINLGFNGAFYVGRGRGEMDTNRAKQFCFRIFWARAAAAGRKSRQQNKQIEIESVAASYHSDRYKIVTHNQSKVLMGRQYNKAEKKKRRQSYNKRRNEVAHAKKKKAAK
jgi:hypothetical protein